MSSLSARFGAACGAVYVLGSIVGNEVLADAGSAPGPAAPATEVAAFLELRRASGTFDLAVGAEVVGLLALLVFTGVLANLLVHRGRPQAAHVTALAMGVMVAIKFASGPAAMVAVDRVGTVPAETVALLVALNTAAFLTTLPLFGLGVLSIAVGSWTTSILPRVVVYAAAPVGGALVVAPWLGELAFLPMLLAMIWMLVISVLLTVRPRPVARSLKSPGPALADPSV